jgi:CheY-like chemotaxis protein
LRQVLLNLTNNAVKFTSEGHIAVLISGGRREGCARAALGVDSREGKGATFWFNLEMECDPGAVEEASAPQLRRKHLLVLDDHPLTRRVLSRHAESWGMRPVLAAGCAEAAASLRRAAEEGDPFPLAVVDARMPDTDEAGLYRMLGESPWGGIRVVVLTPMGVPAPVGCSAASLSKPVKPRELPACLNRLAADTAPPGAVAPRRKERAWTGASRGRVLIAEDNPINQRVASLQVTSLGFETDVVANGEEALEALARMAYSLVLMDCQMPLMDGIAATRELRRREAEGAHTPVIALTANAFASDREACLAAGMDAFLSKPVNLGELAEVLDRWSAGRG